MDPASIHVSLAADEVSAIAASAAAIGSLGLMRLTHGYLRETRRLADQASDQLTAHLSPLLVAEDDKHDQAIAIEATNARAAIELRVVNHGLGVAIVERIEAGPPAAGAPSVLERTVSEVVPPAGAVKRLLVAAKRGHAEWTELKRLHDDGHVGIVLRYTDLLRRDARELRLHARRDGGRWALETA